MKHQTRRRNGRGVAPWPYWASRRFALRPVAARTFTLDHPAWAAKPALAVVDFRGSGSQQPSWRAFNSTLFDDLQGSGLFDMKPKSLFPAEQSAAAGRSAALR